MQSALSVTQIKRNSITLHHRIVQQTTSHHTTPHSSTALTSTGSVDPQWSAADACKGYSPLGYEGASPSEGVSLSVHSSLEHVQRACMVDYDRLRERGMREEEKGRENEKEGMIREREKSVGLLMRQSRASLKELHR